MIRQFLENLWLGNNPSHHEIEVFQRELLRESARDREPDDHYSKQYIREVRKRIISGQKPAKPIIKRQENLLLFARWVGEK